MLGKEILITESEGRGEIILFHKNIFWKSMKPDSKKIHTMLIVILKV